MPGEGLRHTQTWLQSALLEPEEAEGVDEVVTASATLTARYRLAIYQQGYRARLVECMRAHYPVVRAVLGDDVFDAFALEYLRSRPSRSRTLRALGEGFPDFLDATRPEEDPADREYWADALVDLARFEHEFGEAYAAPDADGAGCLSAAGLPPVGSPGWKATVLTPVPCVRLLRADFPVHLLAAAVRRGENPPPLVRSPVRLCLSRTGFAVSVAELAERDFALLCHLAAGERVGEAAHRAGMGTAHADAALRRWLDRRLFGTCDTPLARVGATTGDHARKDFAP